MSLTEQNYANHSDPATALRISQKSPTVLSKSSTVTRSLPWSLIGAVESPEEWAELERTFYACLRAQDDKAAHLCLERISKRFGKGNERVVALRGLYHEAIAEDEEELRKVLSEYNKILEDNPMNIPVHKRRIALIRSIGRPHEAITSLVAFLAGFPTDTEAWCELSDLYQSLGFLAQAIFSLEEALLAVPNAWNLQAKLGELNYIASQSGLESTETNQRYLVDAIRRFSRSAELCDDYLRGYYGLKLATDKYLSAGFGKKNDASIPATDAQKLNKLATDKLESIIQAWSSHKVPHLNESEIIATQALLHGK